MMVATYGPPRKPAVPCNWEVDISCCNPPPSGSILQSAVEYGALVMWAATGRRFGLCEHTVRPCGKANLIPNMGGYYWSEGTWQPYIFNGIWRNCGGCGSGVGCCTCEATCRVWIPGPVAAIPATGISQDGAIVPVDAWRVDDGEWLVRTDGNCWPDCQNYDVNSGTGFFSVTYSKGIPVPGVLSRAAGELACEWARACQSEDCRLPQRVLSLARQGVTVSMANIDDLLNKGLTGISTVDQVIASFNPYGLKSRMRIASLDDDVVHETTIF